MIWKVEFEVKGEGSTDVNRLAQDSATKIQNYINSMIQQNKDSHKLSIPGDLVRNSIRRNHS